MTKFSKVVANPRDEILLDEFMRDMLIQGYAKRTIQEYSANIRRYLLTTGKNLENSERKDITSYYLELYGKVDRSYLSTVCYAFRLFWRWFAEKKRGENIATDFRPPRAKVVDPYLPTDDDINLAIEYCWRKATRARTPKRKFTFFEDAAMIAFIVGSGVRVSELIEVKIGDISFDPTGKFFRLKVFSPKSGRQREFDFAYIGNSTPVGEVFSLYWEYRLLNFKYSPSDPLFPSLADFPIGSTKLDRALVWRRFKRISNGISKGRMLVRSNVINPHSLRHYNATNLYLNGMNLHLIQYRLGHAYISTTEKYIHVASRRTGTLVAHMADRNLRLPFGISGFAKIIRPPKTS